MSPKSAAPAAQARLEPVPPSSGLPALAPQLAKAGPTGPDGALALLTPGGADADLLADAARRYLRARRRRDTMFPQDIFADPCWDMLLDLFVSQELGRDVSVSSACIAACVPQSTALRWLARLESMELVERVPDPEDGRRTLIRLSDPARHAVRDWVAATFLTLQA